jgi:hypothetical protein
VSLTSALADAQFLSYHSSIGQIEGSLTWERRHDAAPGLARAWWIRHLVLRLDHADEPADAGPRLYRASQHLSRRHVGRNDVAPRPMVPFRSHPPGGLRATWWQGK